MMINRRDLLKGCGLGIVAVTVQPSLIFGQGAAAPAVVIKTNSNYGPGQWYFDPLGVYIQKGQKVRWESTKWGGTVTAFHPSNHNHELRIPENAKPFDSGVLAEGGFMNTFEWTFEVEGTYDYFSFNHEITGMVGRIVVGTPGGPAEKAPGYGGRDGRAVMFPAQARALNAVPSKLIVEKKSVPFPRDLNVRPAPYGE
jgi:plastocyanin